MATITPLFVLIFLISPIGIVILSLLLWALSFIISYLISPFAFSRRGYKLTRPYRIYQSLEPGDRRSRAIFCLANSLPLAIGVGFFMGLILIGHWRATGFNVNTILLAVIFITMIIALVFFRDLLLNKLIQVKMIKVNDPA